MAKAGSNTIRAALKLIYRTIFGVISTVGVVSLVLLVYALIQVAAIQAQLREDIGSDMLWASAQAQQEGLRLMTDIAVAHAAGQTVVDGRVFGRYEIFLSRLTLLLTGPQKRYLLNIDELEPLVDTVADFESAISWQDGRQLHREELGLLMAGLQPVLSQLQVLANRVLQQERSIANELRLDQIKALSLVMIAIAGATLSSVLLILWLSRQTALARNAQSVAEKAKAFSDLLIEASGEGLIVIDDRFICVRCNRAICRIFNLDAQRIVGRSVLSSLILPQAAGQLEHAIIDALKGRVSMLRDINISTSQTGVAQYYDLMIFPILLGSGLNGVVVSVRDNTERHHAVLAAKQQHDDLHLLLDERSEELNAMRQLLGASYENSMVGTMLFAPDGAIMMSNDALHKQLHTLEIHLSAQPTGEEFLHAINQRLGELLPSKPSEPLFTGTRPERVELTLPNNTQFIFSFEVLSDGSSQFRIVEVEQA